MNKKEKECFYNINGNEFCNTTDLCAKDTDDCKYIISGSMRPLDITTTRVLDEFWRPFIENCNQHFS
jgi:hypothetical protein